MSGGIAYVWDKDKDFARQCNTETYGLEAVADSADVNELKTLISNHLLHTGSPVARQILDNWSQSLSQFVKVMPTDYKKALQLKPDMPFTLNNLGSAQRKKGDHKAAIESYSSAIKLKADYFIAYNYRGSAKQDAGDFKGAIDDFSKALSIKSDYSYAYNNRAAAKYKLKDYKGSEEDCSKAIQIDPAYGYAYMNRGIARELLRNEKGACDDWRKAAELGVESAKNYNGDCQ